MLLCVWSASWHWRLEERESARECVDGDGEEGDQGREKRGA